MINLTYQEAFEQLLETITIKFDEHQQALEDIWDENHVVLDREAASMADYHEGAVEVLSIVRHQAEEMYKHVR